MISIFGQPHLSFKCMLDKLWSNDHKNQFLQVFKPDEVFFHESHVLLGQDLSYVSAVFSYLLSLIIMKGLIFCSWWTISSLELFSAETLESSKQALEHDIGSFWTLSLWSVLEEKVYITLWGVLLNFMVRWFRKLNLIRFLGLLLIRYFTFWELFRWMITQELMLFLYYSLQDCGIWVLCSLNIAAETI